MTPSSGDGLILRIAPHGESDKLVTWYSAQNGRITAIAKGAQKSRRRFSNKLEPFSLLHFYYRPPRSASGLYFLEDADLIQANLQMRQQYPKYLAASCIAELTLRFTRELDADRRVYSLLTWTMEEMTRTGRFFKYPLFFHLKLLQLAGYMPDFSTCHACGRPITTACTVCLPQPGPASAILRCQGCGHGGHIHNAAEQSLSLQTLRMLHHAQQASLDTLRKLQPQQPSILQGLQFLHLYSQQLLQTDLHVWRVLRQQLVAPHQVTKAKTSGYVCA